MRLALLLLLSLVAQGVSATSAAKSAFGVFGGTGANSYSRGLELDQLLLDTPLPWSRGTGGLVLSARLQTSIARLTDEGEDALVFWLGPALAASAVNGWFLFEAGLSPALLSDHRFGGRDLGGTLQFVTYLGIGVGITRDLVVSARWQHMSNAGLYDSNPGINLYVLGLTYRFSSSEP